jgi:hypothetical protein
MTDVTQKLLHETQHALGDLAKMARRAAPAKKIEGSLLETWKTLTSPGVDTSLGFMSNVLLYGSMFRGRPRAFHRDVFRMLKGGFLVVVQEESSGGPPPEAPCARRDNPHSSTWYGLAANPEMQHLFPEV